MDHGIWFCSREARGAPVNPWQGINRFLLTYREALAAMRRFRIWSPFLLYLVVQLVVIGVLALAVRPPFVDFFARLPHFVIPEAFFSYPLHFLLLPFVYFRVLSVPLGALFESFLVAAATLMFVRFFADRGTVPGIGRALAHVRSGYLLFVAFWVLNYLLLLGYHYLFDATLGDLWVGYGRRRMLLDTSEIALSVLINSLLAYTTVIIVTERASFLHTLTRSLRFFGRHWLATLCFVGIARVLMWPFGWFLQQAPEWIGRFNPEIMLLVMGADVLWGTIMTFVLTAVLCFWYLLDRQTA
jgi:hypothetical protein